MSIDPRLAERRKAVAEDRAQRNVGRTLKLVVAAALVGAVAWLAFSPFLAVDQVRTTGILRSDAHAILADHDIVAGTPMVMIRTGAAQDALLEDPWIRDARIYLNWPDQAIVRVTERVPIAWVETADGWTRFSAGAVAVPSKSTPDDVHPRLLIPGVTTDEASGSAVVEGAVEFYSALSPVYAQGSEMRLRDGELWATVNGYEVRLGRPIEMEAKALTLEVMLGENLPTESTIVLIAPNNPAVSPSDGANLGANFEGSGGGDIADGDEDQQP